MQTTNKCCGCKVCCSVLEVKTLCKAAGYSCRHLSGNGCSMYEDRPDECRRFSCLWLGAMAKRGDLRPDRSGLFMYPDRNQEVGDYILCHELVAGACNRHEDLLYGLSEATCRPLVVRLCDGTLKAIYTSRDQLERLLPVTDLARTLDDEAGLFIASDAPNIIDDRGVGPIEYLPPCLLQGGGST